MELYLDLPPHLRVPVAKLRTSFHLLRIETGIYNLPAALPPDKRSCWFRDNDSIEDELHFLFKCKLYTSLQELQELTTHCCLLNPSFMHLSDLDKWKFISSCNDNKLVYLHSKFVAVAFELRRNSIIMILMLPVMFT